MKRIVATWPSAPRTKESQTVAIVLAAVLAVMTAAQLFSFEKFIPLLESMQLPGEATGRIVAALLVALSVAALPFLLQMKLSIGFRWLSMGAGWLVLALWLLLAVWMNVADECGKCWYSWCERYGDPGLVACGGCRGAWRAWRMGVVGFVARAPAT